MLTRRGGQHARTSTRSNVIPRAGLAARASGGEVALEARSDLFS